MSVGSDLESVTSEVLGLVALGIEPLEERMTTRWLPSSLAWSPDGSKYDPPPRPSDLLATPSEECVIPAHTTLDIELPLSVGGPERLFVFKGEHVQSLPAFGRYEVIIDFETRP